MTCALYSTPSWSGTDQQERVGGRYRLVLGELRDQHVGLRRVGAAEDRPRVLVDVTVSETLRDEGPADAGADLERSCFFKRDPP